MHVHISDSPLNGIFLTWPHLPTQMEYSLLGHISPSNGIFLTGTHLPIQWNIPYLDTSPHPNGIFLSWTHLPIQMEYPLLGHISPSKYNIPTGTHLPIEMEYRLLGHISPIEMEYPLLTATIQLGGSKRFLHCASSGEKRRSRADPNGLSLDPLIIGTSNIWISWLISLFMYMEIFNLEVGVLYFLSFRERNNSKKRADHFVSIPFQTPSV